MNCNALKSVYIDRTGDWVRSGNDTGKFYLKEEVDAVIAELKQKLEEAQAGTLNRNQPTKNEVKHNEQRTRTHL